MGETKFHKITEKLLNNGIQITQQIQDLTNFVNNNSYLTQ